MSLFSWLSKQCKTCSAGWMYNEVNLINDSLLSCYSKKPQVTEYYKGSAVISCSTVDYLIINTSNACLCDSYPVVMSRKRKCDPTCVQCLLARMGCSERRNDLSCHYIITQKYFITCMQSQNLQLIFLCLSCCFCRQTSLFYWQMYSFLSPLLLANFAFFPHFFIMYILLMLRALLLFYQVELIEETRQLDSTYFRKLQALHKETFSKKTEVRQLSTQKNQLFILERITAVYIGMGQGDHILRRSYPDKVGDRQFHSSATSLPRMLRLTGITLY